MTSAERVAEELLVAAVERPFTLWLLAEQAASELQHEAADALVVLAEVCAVAFGELAQLRGVEVGKILDEHLGGSPVAEGCDLGDEQAAVARILELRAEGRSPRVIAQTLTAEGYYRRANWSMGAVAEVVRREVARARG